MDLSVAQELLERAQRHRVPEREASIFDVAGRGYYENPTTDLLAFFLDPQGGHGLGDCFLRALLSCTPGCDELNAALIGSPEREVPTDLGNRIDLLLRGDGWVLVLENKIFHDQINPFEDYEQHVEKPPSGASDQRIFVILSPSGSSARSRWAGLSYGTLLEAVRRELAPLSLSQPIGKWQIFAREFVLHLENLTVQQSIDSNTIRFVLDHMHQIEQLNRLRTQVIDALDQKIVAQIQTRIPGIEVSTRRHTWNGEPALRYTAEAWMTKSDVVLYLDTSGDTLKPHVRVYVLDVAPETLALRAADFLEGEGADSWRESGRKILVLNWKLDGFDEQQVFELIADKMQRLDRFEREGRASTSIV